MAQEAQEPDAAQTKDAESEQPEVLLDAFGEPIVQEEEQVEEAKVPQLEAILEESPAVEAARRERQEFRETVSGAAFLPEEEGEKEFELERNKGKTQRRNDRQKRRQLVLDEASGEVIAKRRRKGSRGSWDEEDWEDYDY